MQRLAFPLALLAAFFLGGLSLERPGARTWAQDGAEEEPQTAPEPEKPKRQRRQGGPASDMPQLIWERLNTKMGQGVALRCSRSKVPGGWLVLVERVQRQGRRNRGKNAEGGAGQARQGPPVVQPTLTFLPDPGHGWDGGSPK